MITLRPERESSCGGIKMFGKIKESIDKGIVSVSVKSSTYLEIEKLKTKVGNTAGKMDIAASEMGAAVYSQWKSGSVNMEYIGTVCTYIKELEEEIAVYQAQIGQLEQEKVKILGGDEAVPGTAGCGNGITCACGYVNEQGARFCINCGKPLLKSEEPEDTTRACPSCGIEVERGARFCCGCGKPLE